MHYITFFLPVPVPSLRSTVMINCPGIIPDFLPIANSCGCPLSTPLKVVSRNPNTVNKTTTTKNN